MKKILKIVVGFLVVAFLMVIGFLLFRKNNIVSYQTAVTECKEPNSHFYEWNGLQCHYTLSGKGADTIVMIHGLGGSHKNFNLVTNLLQKNYTVYCFDLPAFGLSEVPDMQMDNDKILAFYRDFMDESFAQLGLSTFHIWGNSLGGWMAWDYTGRNPQHVETMTLLNAAGFGMDKAKSAATSWMTSPIGKILFKKGIPYSKAKENAERCLWDPSKVNKDKVHANHLMNNKENTLNWMIKMASSNVMPDTSLLSHIVCPSLVVWGQEDAIVNVESAIHFNKNLPNDTLVIIDHCGHVPMIEYPEKTVEIWESFIKSTAIVKENTAINSSN